MELASESLFSFRRRIRKVGIAIFVLASFWFFKSVSVAENWTSLRGNRTVQARMAGMWDDHVVLVLSDGRQVNVHIDSLNAESRIQAKKVAEKLQQQRQSLSRELQGAARAEAASAPDPLPEPPATEPYSAPSPNLKPDAAVTLIQDQLAAGHLIVLYDSMPLKFRNELDTLTALAMKKLESFSWNDSMTQLHRLADLLVTKQNWILSYPSLLEDPAASNSPNQKGEIFQNLILPIAGLIRTGLPPEATTTEAIASSGFGPWLRQRDEVIAPYLAMLLDKYSSRKYTWTLLDDTGDQTILQATAMSSDAGESNTLSVAMKKVDGYWIPESFADGFSEWIQTQTAALEKFEDGTMSISAFLGGESIGLASLASSDSTSSDGEYGDEEEYARMMAEEEMAMNESYDELSYEDGSSGYGSASQAKAGEFSPPMISGDLLGTVVQSLRGFGGLIGPLESAPDKTMFHQSVQQTVSPLAGMIDMLGR